MIVECFNLKPSEIVDQFFEVKFLQRTVHSVVSFCSPHIVDTVNRFSGHVCKELGWNFVSNGVRDLRTKELKVLVKRVLGSIGLVVVEVLLEPFPDIICLFFSSAQIIGDSIFVSVHELLRFEVVSDLLSHHSPGMHIGRVSIVGVLIVEAVLLEN